MEFVDILLTPVIFLPDCDVNGIESDILVTGMVLPSGDEICTQWNLFSI